MNAIEFVKEHGFNEAKIIVSTYPNHTHVTDDARMFINAGTYKKQVPHFADSVDSVVKISDLKQIVDAFELVESYGGIHGFKTYCNGDFSDADLKAVSLVEQCNA